MAKESHIQYKPTPEGVEKIQRLRAKVIELDDLIDELTFGRDQVPAVARARALAKTHLEDCRMRAVEAVVRRHNEGSDEPQNEGSQKA